MFLAGQLLAGIAERTVTPVVQLPHGVQLALLGVILPALFGMVLTTMWLVRAATGIGGPRGGRPVHGSSRHAYRTPSGPTRSR
jgi:hypothetical protein